MQTKGLGVRSPRPSITGRVVACALAAGLVVASACTFQESPSGTDAGNSTEEFRIVVGVEPDTLDPAGQSTTTIANMVDYAVETLVRIDREGNIQPGLAKSWEVSEDGRTITLQLQSGVTFHDGSTFNAEAVKFSLERMLDPKVPVPIRAPYEAIDEVEAADDQTVELRLGEPSAALINALSWTTSGIISPKSVEQHGNSYRRIVHPVGTGPYEFVGYRKGDRVDFEAFNDYWGQKPTYTSVSIRIVPEAATRESILLAGQAEMIILPPVPDLESLQGDDDVRVLLAPSDRSIFIAMNNKDPLFSDVRVRQALNYAVDKEALIRNVLFGAADPLDAPMDPELAGYCKVGFYDYDPAKARSLLTQAGETDLSVTFGSPTGRYLQDIQAAEAISGELRKVGVEAKIETMDWASYQSAVTLPSAEQRFDMHLLGWAPSFLDASVQMDVFQTSFHPPEGLATSFYSNPKVDALVEKADRELDDATRERLFCQASKIVWREAPWIFLWSQRFPIVHSSEVTGISYLPNEKFDAVYARPAE
jgi:peptide/nickel transport system substrate-binding protein